MTVKVTVLGNLARDAEIKGEGKAENIGFSVAGTYGYGDKMQTIWFDCRLWQPNDAYKKLAETMLKKGTRCLVLGDMSVYVGKDGIPRNQLTVHSVNVVSKAMASKNGAAKEAPKPQPVVGDDGKPFDDEIPF